MDRRLFYLINQARHRLYTHVNEASLERLGVSATQVGALFFLAGNDGCRQSDLAEALGLTKSTASGLTSRLERAALIERRPSPADRRAHRLHITDDARDLLPKASTMLGALNAELTGDFTADEVEVVHRFLNHVIATFAKTAPSKRDPSKTGPSKTDSAKTDAAKTDSAKTDSAKTDSAKTDSAKTDSAKTDSSNTEPGTQETT